MSVPQFAVVGYVNMGKSSLVSTLTETDSVEISPQSGTTSVCTSFDCMSDGQHLFTLIDTPGFQNARRLLRWLEDWLEANNDSTDPQALRAFIAEQKQAELFENEWRLLKPIMEGASILYIVDADVPYKSKYKAEMQILSMTGQPRMGIINMHGDCAHLEQWKEALSSSFAKVHQINAQNAKGENRWSLFEAFAGINEDLKPKIDTVIAQLKKQVEQRKEQVAKHLASLVCDGLTASSSKSMLNQSDKNQLSQQCREELKKKIRQREELCRKQVEQIFEHRHLVRNEQAIEVLESDIFSDEVWSMLGLNKTSLLTASTMSSAGIGALIDLKLGGLSFGTGALIGAGIGLLTGFYATQMDFSFKVMGVDLGLEKRKLVIQAPKSLKWASILLDRGLIHYHKVASRSHAQRSPLTLENKELSSILNELSKDKLKSFSEIIEKIIKNSDDTVDEKHKQELSSWIEEQL